MLITAYTVLRLIRTELLGTMILQLGISHKLLMLSFLIRYIVLPILPCTCVCDMTVYAPACAKNLFLIVTMLEWSALDSMCTTSMLCIHVKLYRGIVCDREVYIHVYLMHVFGVTWHICQSKLFKPLTSRNTADWQAWWIIVLSVTSSACLRRICRRAGRWAKDWADRGNKPSVAS